MDDNYDSEPQFICPITARPCEGDLSHLCEDYGCARKGGLSPHSEENLMANPTQQIYSPAFWLFLARWMSRAGTKSQGVTRVGRAYEHTPRHRCAGL